MNNKHKKDEKYNLFKKILFLFFNPRLPKGGGYFPVR